MNYANSATGRTPAHIVYVLDASGSMELEMPGTNKRKIDFISDILEEVAYQIYLRSKRGTIISERYRIALIAYGNTVTEVTNGDFITVKEFLQSVPEFGDLKRAATNTVEAMMNTRELLKKTIKRIGDNYPPPIICHLTDGEYTKEYGNPSDVMKEIMHMETPDGKILLENIYLGAKTLSEPTSNATNWAGISDAQELYDSYSQFLYEHSSVWPDRYVKYFNDTYQFNIKSNARMFFPAENIDLIKMAFTASTATPRRSNTSIEEV